MILVIGAVLLFATTASARFPATELRGTVSEISIEGPVTGRPVVFSIYLPEGYGESNERYPVVYHLHGRGGSHRGNQLNVVPANFEMAKRGGLIGDVIIVFPDGYVDSSWGDAWDGSRPAETNIIKEIIPYVDGNFRTVDDSSHRFIQGFSMGASGALKFIAKYPDLFSRAWMYDAPYVSWERMLSFGDRAKIYCNNDREYFEEHSCWKFLKRNRELFTGKNRLGIVAGSLKIPNEDMHLFLDSLGIAHTYVVSGCKHTLPCLLDSQGMNAARSYHDAMSGK